MMDEACAAHGRDGKCIQNYSKEIGKKDSISYTQTWATEQQ